MLRTMPKVGKAICQSHFWVLADEWIHCVLNSAGGHGTDKAIAIYTEELAKMKVKLVHQIPQSLDTNVLDLGIWMSLQSAVEKKHRLRRGDKDALHASVMHFWDEVTNEEAFKKVFNRLKNYKIIEKFGGGNDLVEGFHGKGGTAQLEEVALLGTAAEVAGLQEMEIVGTSVNELELQEMAGDNDGTQSAI